MSDQGTREGESSGVAVDRRDRDPFRFLLELSRHPGGVVRYRAGGEEAYLVTEPFLIKRVLADNSSNYSKDTFINATFKLSVADGLLTSEGALWRRQRQLVQPAFHRDRLAALASGMVREAAGTVERWAPLADTGRPVDMAAEMGALTLRITAGALFGFDIGNDADQLGDVITKGLAALAAPHKPEFQEGKRRLEQLVTQLVDQRYDAPERSDDVLSMLVEARDENTGEPMSSEEIRDEVITLILAGYETTANSLAWTWYLLAQNPSVLEELESELDTILAGRLPTVEDLGRLPYSKMVLDESLRLYPPAWILGRRALHEDRLGDVVIPAGSVVALSPYAMHRHPAYWEDPERFEPRRFMPERSTAARSFAYLPFGGGPRLCIGHNMAIIESRLIIATLAQHYRLRLAPGAKVVADRRFVLRPKGGLPMTVHARHGSSDT